MLPSLPMSFTPRLIETKVAAMRLVGPGFIEQRFRDDVAIDLAGFEENRRARLELGGDGEYVMLSILPEGLDFKLEVTTSDHFRPEKYDTGLKALAVVAMDSMGEAVAKLYFSYFPQEFPTRIFPSEEQARTWLLEELGR